MKSAARSPILLTSYGSLDKPEKIRSEGDSIKKYPGKKIIITGWDFQTARPLADSYNADGLITESCILRLKPSGGWANKTKLIPLYTNADMRYVKRANSVLLDKILDYAKKKKVKAIFKSQGNEIGICYYINEPSEITAKIKAIINKKVMVKSDPVMFQKFFEEHGIKTRIDTAQNLLEIPDTEESRYWVEKANGMLRTFQPYSMRIDDKKGNILLNLNPRESNRKFNSNDMTLIVSSAWDEGALSSEEYRRIKPQSDVCIDIFCRPKEETWKDALERAKLYEAGTPIVYLSKGTQSDIPLILRGYATGKFYAYVSSDINDKDVLKRLKEIGVKVAGSNVEEVIRFIKKERYT